MIYPSKEEFLKLSKKGNLIPVYKEIIADTETPVSAYKKIESKNAFLLESVEGGEKLARYSFLGSDPIFIIKSKGDRIEVIEGKKKRAIKGDPFDALKDIMSRYKLVEVKELPRFHGGLVGYFGYDMIRFIEDIPDKNPDEINKPDMQFMLADVVLAFDHIKQKIIIIANTHVKDDPKAAYKKAVAKLNEVAKKLKKPLGKKDMELEAPRTKKTCKFKTNLSRAKFSKMVERAKGYIRSGDIIQVVLSQRLSAKAPKDTFRVYRMLRSINPSPYMFYLKFDDLKLIGSSPEIMVRMEKGAATVRPIAGTRPRGENAEEDNRLEKQLLADAKEKAEHIMLVDLGRNDLGRVCEFGSVKVNELMAIERYSHVMHIVSDVSGKIRKGFGSIDLIRACFPAGTVTGAPKVRAMEIIDELENIRRGPYAGAVGYFCFSGDLDTCITIRTIIADSKKFYVQAGAGIVADSVPEREYEETLNKAKALLRAIEMAL